VKLTVAKLQQLRQPNIIKAVVTIEIKQKQNTEIILKPAKFGPDMIN